MIRPWTATPRPFTVVLLVLGAFLLGALLDANLPQKWRRW